jgi:hypothetical protein
MKLNFELNRKWKKGKYYKQRKFDNDFISMFVPWYELSQLRGSGAVIFNGRQIIIKKMPKNTEYFIDKNLGIFEINPDKAFFLNKTPIYFYDVRNQNALDLGLLEDLYQWGNHNGLYKIRRVDVEHGARLRNVEESKLNEVKAQEKRETRKFMASVLSKIRIDNEETEKKRELDGGEEESEEYAQIDEHDSNFLIVKNLFDNGYIDSKQAENLNHKLTLKTITKTDELLHEIDSFTNVYVTKPISNSLERVLDDFHTYKPRDIVEIIKSCVKIRKGIDKLRTKAVTNWFPSMYILFGAIGVILAYMIISSGSFTIPEGVIPGS